MGALSGSEPVQIRLWAGGWWLVGNGPSFLLFHSAQKEVTHLVSGMHRELREGLRGYSAFQDDGTLAPLVRALSGASAEAIYDLDPRTNASERKWTAYLVVREFLSLIGEFPEREIFKRHLGKLASSLRAAGRYAMYHGPPGVPEAAESPPGSFFARDQYGQRLLVTSARVYRCEPDSRIARCAEELWRREQVHWGDQRTVLYRVPTRKELREHLCCDESAITKLCRREGCDWLPSAQRGKKNTDPPHALKH